MGLTAKQRAFAKLVANGTAKTVAYDQVYGNKGGRSTSRQVDSSKLSVKPAVAQAIIDYQEQLTPIVDMRRTRQEMLSNMRWLATESPDHKVRLAATKMLHDIAESREERERTLISKSPINVSELLQELESLRAGRAVKTLELEAGEAPAGEAEQSEAGEAEQSE